MEKKIEAVDLLKFTKISEYYTGKKRNIMGKDIPDKWKSRIDNLIKLMDYGLEHDLDNVFDAIRVNDILAYNRALDDVSGLVGDDCKEVILMLRKEL